MCGRFTLYSDYQKIVKQFALTENTPVDFIPSYNIAPSQSIYVIAAMPDVENNIKRTITSMQWGFIPTWSKFYQFSGVINARLDTIDKKPLFKKAIQQHRCLIIANGFYEWKAEKNRKQPYYISMRDNSLFGMAGIWEHWKGEKESITSCAIITTDANPALSSIHDRMPAIVKPEYYTQWLESSYQDIAKIKALIQTYPAENLQFFPVDRKVNNFRYNNAECIKTLTLETVEELH